MKGGRGSRRAVLGFLRSSGDRSRFARGAYVVKRRREEEEDIEGSKKAKEEEGREKEGEINERAKPRRSHSGSAFVRSVFFCFFRMEQAHSGESGQGDAKRSKNRN